MHKPLILNLSEAALLNLKEIRAHTKKHYGADKAKEYSAALKKSFELLLNSPAIGHSRDDLPDGYLIWIVQRHLIIYYFDDIYLTVVSVIHGSRDIDQIFH